MRYLVLPVVAVVAGLARWLFFQGQGQGQGEGQGGEWNLYTMRATRYYAPDPDLGWRLVEHGPPRLGLEAIGAMTAWACGIGAAVLAMRWLERRRGRPMFGPAARMALWLASALPLAVPAWAFSRGSLPPGAQTRAPAGVTEAPAGVVEGGIPGLHSAAGTWTIVPHAGTAVTADIDAGGEQFEARFPRVNGSWRGAPADLRQPMSADIWVAAADVDTGIDLRSKHTREDYLQAEKYPRIGFRLIRIVGAQAKGNEATFRAQGEVSLIGKTHPVEVTGTMRAIDAAARQRLGISGDAPLLLVDARFELRIADTALAPDRGDFGRDTIPLRVNLLMQPDVQRHQSSPGGSE